MKVSYNWLREYLGENIPAPEDVAELLTFHAFEVESVESIGDDAVIDVKILPDRGSDCLSVRGIAREIATLLDRPLAHDPLLTLPVIPSTDSISVVIAEPEACPRFTASLITGVRVGPSPQWLQDRLLAIGQRPINTIVDATNYVMFALGQPLHAYDAELFPQVEGKWKFLVRTARSGEIVNLLPEGGKEEDRIVVCQGTELLIVDASTDTPIGLAGVKGGSFAGVHAGTTKVLIEAAHFDPVLTRKTARGLGIVIDASKRFENEPARELPPYAQAEIIHLICAIAGGHVEGMIDVYRARKDPPRVPVRVAQVQSLLGLSLSHTEMVALLKRAGVTVENSEDVLICTGPLERTDLNIPEDFIEEIGRIYGYQHIKAVVPPTVLLTEVNARHYYAEQFRDMLIQLGFSEVITSSFQAKDDVKLANALAKDKEYLRSSLVINISDVLDKNAHVTDLLGTQDTRVFEIGTVFKKGGERGITEHIALCIGVRKKVGGYSKADDALLEEVTNALRDTSGNTTLSFTVQNGVAELNFSELLTTLAVPAAYATPPSVPPTTYRPYSIYPSSSRDIAMWVEIGTEVAVAAATLRSAAGPLLVRLTHLDTFEKDNRVSLAFRLVLQSFDRTLTDTEITTVMDRVYATVAHAGYEIR